MKKNLMIQTFSVGQTAKIIQFPAGEYKLFEWLRKRGFLLEDNTPAQKYIDRGWLMYVDTDINTGRKRIIVPVARFTVKGIAGLSKIVEKEFPICKPCGDGK